MLNRPGNLIKFSTHLLSSSIWSKLCKMHEARPFFRIIPLHLYGRKKGMESPGFLLRLPIAIPRLCNFLILPGCMKIIKCWIYGNHKFNFFCQGFEFDFLTLFIPYSRIRPFWTSLDLLYLFCLLNDNEKAKWFLKLILRSANVQKD